MSQCQFVKRDGQECQAKALKGDDFCFFHSQKSNIVKKRQRANSKGGLVRVDKDLGRRVCLVSSTPLKSISQVMDLLDFTINSFLQGKMAKSKATGIGYLANILIGAIKENDFEQRLEVIESAIGLSKKN